MGIQLRRRGSTLGLVRLSKAKKPDGPVGGFIVTWDVDRRDQAMNGRVRRFIFGYETRSANGGDKVYRYPGFVYQEGVFYLGRSVVFVESRRLDDLLRFVSHFGVSHEIRSANLT